MKSLKITIFDGTTEWNFLRENGLFRMAVKKNITHDSDTIRYEFEDICKPEFITIMSYIDLKDFSYRTIFSRLFGV